LEETAKTKKEIEALTDHVLFARCDVSMNDIPKIIPGPQRMAKFSRASNPGEWMHIGEVREYKKITQYIIKHSSKDIAPKTDLWEKKFNWFC